MRVRTRAARGVTAAAVGVALLASGCTSNASGGRSSGRDGSSAPESGNVLGAYRSGLINVVDTGSSKPSRVLNFGAYSEPAVLDPSKSIVAGSTGGVELAAIYDELLRYDETSKKVVPQLAKSLTASADFQTWTLKLRPGVNFSDGTPLNAAAVLHSIQRYVKNGGDDSSVWKLNVQSAVAKDDHTVVFKLKKKWPTFNFLFTVGLGMIVAPSAEAGGTFKPIGAGPFTFTSRAPQENLVVTANPHYWQGKPRLAGVKFNYLNDPNTTYDSFKSGSLQMAFESDAAVVDKALQDKTPGNLQMVPLGTMVAINAKAGHPGADVRVRKAIQLAVDPKVVAQRASGGAGVASSDIFPAGSAGHNSAHGLPYDPKQARTLLAEAKKDGYDGKITYLAASSTSGRAAAVAYKAFLDAVGFDTTIKVASTISELINSVAVKGDYDMSTWGFSWREVGSFARMFSTSDSKGNVGVGTATSPQMDALLEKFQSQTTAQQKPTLAKIQTEWNRIVPALVLGPKAEFMIWQKGVQGVKTDTNTIVLLDQAWIN